MRGTRRNRLGVALGCLVGCGAVVVLGPLLALLCRPGIAKPFRPGRMGRVVTQIRQGRLRPDAAGVVVLPAELASLTPTHRAYVTQQPGRLAVFFPSWVGRTTLWDPIGSGDAWVEGYLYDSAVPPGGMMVGPAGCEPWRAGTDTGMDTWNLNDDGRLAPRWYYAHPFE